VKSGHPGVVESRKVNLRQRPAFSRPDWSARLGDGVCVGHVALFWSFSQVRLPKLS